MRVMSATPYLLLLLISWVSHSLDSLMGTKRIVGLLRGYYGSQLEAQQHFWAILTMSDAFIGPRNMGWAPSMWQARARCQQHCREQDRLGLFLMVYKSSLQHPTHFLPKFSAFPHSSSPPSVSSLFQTQSKALPQVLSSSLSASLSYTPTQVNEQWKWRSLSCVWLFLTPWTIACQAPLSMGFSRQECWTSCHLLLRGNLPDPGIEPVTPVSPALTGKFFTTEPPGKHFQWHFLLL